MGETINRLETLMRDARHIVAFADMQGALDEKYRDYRYAIVIARKYDDDYIVAIKSGPTLKSFELYNSLKKEMTESVEGIAQELNSRDVPALAIKSHENEDELCADFSHKLAATKSGIGWIGKTGLLVTKRFGPRVRLATILTKSPLGQCGEPIVKSYCGDCNKCVDACPAHAASGHVWRAGVDRSEFLDAFKCKHFCVAEAQRAIGKEICLCGTCLTICPVGKSS